MSLLAVDNLVAGYGKKNIINGVSLEVNEGQIVGLLGPNGCGKSTMLKALCKGLPYQGVVHICGQDSKALSEKELAKICSYVPQRSGLAIEISALETVLLGYYPYLGALGRYDERMKKKACMLLEQVGLGENIHTNYMELSEGQKRMCILARSLVLDAKLLIMDEPDASLDFGVRNRLMQIITERAQQEKTGIILTLHDTDIALSHCDKIYLMKDGSLLDAIMPDKESLCEMEQKLSALYGKVRLFEHFTKQKERKLSMVQA